MRNVTWNWKYSCLLKADDCCLLSIYQDQSKALLHIHGYFQTNCRWSILWSCFQRPNLLWLFKYRQRGIWKSTQWMWELLLFLVVSRHFFITFTLKDSLSHLFYCASTSCPCTFCSCVFIDLLQYLRAKAVHLSMGMLLFANISLLKILSAHMWKHRVSHHTPKYTVYSWDSRCYPFTFYVLWPLLC